LLFKLKILVYKSKDITIQPKKLKNKVIIGLNINKKLLALIGIITSFKINFTASAKG
jgi:hypothetical protein